jgi:L-iditol 2-dehydrogenase
MEEMMKAIVKTKDGKGNVCLQDVPEPQVSAGCVKIKVDSAGICGTDIKIRSGDTWSNPPVVLGHEFSGFVAETGEGVTSVVVGDKVVSETAQVICGHCYYCNTGNYLMCPERLSIGYGVDGAFAEYIVVREHILHKIPDGVPMEDAALCEPLAVAVHAVFDSVALKPTDTVAVIGPGAIGLLVAQVVAAFGADVIIVGVSSDVDRFSIARKLGIEHVVDSQAENVDAVAKDISGGGGVDCVFDCSGAANAINSAFGIVKRGGTIVQVGLTKPYLEIPYAMFPQNEISVKGTFGHNWLSWERALTLIARGKVDVNALITDEYGMSDWEQAFDKSEKQQGVKILIHPNR